MAPNTCDSMHILWKLIHPLPDPVQTDKHTSLCSSPSNSAGFFQRHYLYLLVTERCTQNNNNNMYKFSKSSQSLEGIKQCVWFKMLSLEGNNILHLLISSTTKFTDLNYLNDPQGLFWLYLKHSLEVGLLLRLYSRVWTLGVYKGQHLSSGQSFQSLNRALQLN